MWKNLRSCTSNFQMKVSHWLHLVGLIFHCWMIRWNNTCIWLASFPLLKLLSYIASVYMYHERKQMVSSPFWKFVNHSLKSKNRLTPLPIVRRNLVDFTLFCLCEISMWLVTRGRRGRWWRDSVIVLTCQLITRAAGDKVTVMKQLPCLLTWYVIIIF